MAKLIVAISKVENGNMYIPGDTGNAQVITTRKTWLKSHGIELEQTTRLAVTFDQPDFLRYRTLTNEDKGDGMTSDGSHPADAIVITQPGHAAFLPVADCVATVFYDEAKSIFMLSHLGRHSLEQQGGVKSVEYLVEQFGVDPKTLKVWLGPTPNKAMYPIYKLDNKGMKEALYEQLGEAGIVLDNIIDDTADTVTDPDYYSHTTFLKGGKPEDGRFAMVAMMVEEKI